MGSFYGPTLSRTQEVVASARQAFAAVIGRVDAYQPSIRVDDGASAVVAAMERAPTEVYDVVDDEPLTKARSCLPSRQVSEPPASSNVPKPRYMR